MNVEIREKGKVTILGLEGNLSIGHGDETLRDKVRDLLAAGSRMVILNLTAVPFTDSAGLSEIVACKKRIAERGGEMKVVLRSEQKLNEILAITGLDRALEIFPDEEEALASFTG